MLGASMFFPPLLIPLNFKVPNLNHNIPFQWYVLPPQCTYTSHVSHPYM
jgi:hypothetical protein